jgi:hypothetical protein
MKPIIPNKDIILPEINDSTPENEAMEQVFGLMSQILGTDDDFGKFIHNIHKEVKEKNQKS